MNGCQHSFFSVLIFLAKFRCIFRLQVSAGHLRLQLPQPRVPRFTRGFRLCWLLLVLLAPESRLRGRLELHHLFLLTDNLVRKILDLLELWIACLHVVHFLNQLVEEIDVIDRGLARFGHRRGCLGLLHVESSPSHTLQDGVVIYHLAHRV